MKHFIKLTSHVINKLYITEIIKGQSKYYIYMKNDSFRGTFIFGLGGVSSDRNVIEICAEKNKQDYDTITDFIKKID
jgi:hypothetical protein